MGLGPIYLSEGFPYNERQLTVKAHDLLEESARRGVFGDETDEIEANLREFLEG